MRKTNLCPECGSTSINYGVGEQNCRRCGLVIEEGILAQPFIDEATKSRASTPFLATASSKSPNGTIYRASWILSRKEQSFQAGARKIENLALKLDLPGIVSREAKLIFKKILYSQASKGKNKQNLAYASLYLACKVHQLPKTPLEITANSEVKMRGLVRATKLLADDLRILNRPINSLDILQRFASDLELKPVTIMRIAELLERINGANLSAGKKPETILGGAIYVVGKRIDDFRTQRQIANTLGLNEETIRRMSRNIEILESSDLSGPFINKIETFK
ncbi:MAG: hypothetical protein ACP5N2_03780 [Candidatus Nanoarchaeia archaeon]